MTNSKSRPGRRETELGRGSCHREEESEEVLATRFPSWVRIRPVLPGSLPSYGQLEMVLEAAAAGGSGASKFLAAMKTIYST